jgi:hypothetical protein
MATQRIPQLTDDHANMLTNVQRSAAQTRVKLQQAKDAGLDVDDYIAQNEAQHTLATNIKKHFFPNHP